MNRPFPETYAALAARVERHLPSTLALVPDGLLREAVAHVLLAGGKRFRPVLCLVAAGVDPFADPVDTEAAAIQAAALHAAAALEWMHTYSLVHDDLPALDDDDWRRGRATLHRKYDEATAILAGDVLHAGALALAAGAPCGDGQRADLCAILAGASVAMVQGQVLDTLPAAAPDTPGLGFVLATIDGKTGAMIRAALEMGACVAGTRAANWAAFGRVLGRLFQVSDDLLDVTGTLAGLGKTPGKDAASRKVNLVTLLGTEGARDFLEACRDEARALAASLPADPDLLRALADFVADRKS